MNSGTKIVLVGALLLFVAVALYYGFGPQASNASPKPTPQAPAAKEPPKNAAPNRPTTPTTPPTAPATTPSGAGTPSGVTPPIEPRPATPSANGAGVTDPLSRTGDRPPVNPNAPATSGGKGDAPALPPSTPPSTSPGAGTAPNTPPAAGTTPNTPAGGATPNVPNGGTTPNTPAGGATPPGTNRPTTPPANVTPGGPKPVSPTTPTPSPNAPAPSGGSSAPQAGDGKTHSVASGETMSSIAEKYYGDKNKWSVIAKANPLVDPASMKIGTKLTIPPASAATSSPTAGGTKPTTPTPPAASDKSSDGATHTVVAGETLMSIARNVYNDGNLWERIYEANKSAIGDDPANLKVGMKLVIPKKPS